MQDHPVVSPNAWLEARKALLAREKQFTRLQDELAEHRRRLPWTRVEKPYVFDTPDGRKSLDELFDGRSQLVVYHFMFAPGWTAGCVGCSFFADHIDGANKHLMHHDLTVVAVSRAPLPELAAYRARMGWQFPWVSSFGSDFNHDFHVSFTKDELASGTATYNYAPAKGTMEDLPGISVFTRDASGTIFHTYSAYGRGDERGLGAYMFLDLSPFGRREDGPNRNLGDWVHRHDEYPHTAQ